MGLNKTVKISYDPLNMHNEKTPVGQMLLEYKGEDYVGYCVNLGQDTGAVTFVRSRRRTG